MDELRIFLFSKFCVRGKKKTVNIEARKTQDLFGYLLLNRDRPHPREALAAIFWGDVPGAQAKGYLRKALWQIQSALETQTDLKSETLLLVEQDWIQLNPQSRYWLDVTILEQAYQSVQGVPGGELNPSALQTLRQAIELYRGELLEGCYQEWCLYERERFQQMYLIMLDKLMDYCEAHADYENGLSYGMKILRNDQARERTHRQLMRLHYLAGNRTGALRQYERCAAILEKELGVQPAATTVTLYEQIRDDEPAVVQTLIKKMTRNIPGHTFPLSEDEVIITLAETIEQIKQLQIELNYTQRQIQQKIATVEILLQDQPSWTDVSFSRSSH